MQEYKSKAYNLKIVKDNTSGYNKAKISTSTDAVEYARRFYHEDIGIYESFFILLLNRSNNVIGYAKISQGGVIGTVVDIKIIIKYIVDVLASSVILVHNHPSGNRNPSDADISLTKKIKSALQFVDVQILDHVIITEEDFYSLADNGDI